MNKSTNYLPLIEFGFKSLFKNMAYLNKQTVTVLLVTILFCIQLSPPKFTVNAAANPRIRTNRNPGCNEDQQKKMQEEYDECSREFTNRHHKNVGSAVTAKEQQEYTCQLLVDTVTCDQLLTRCLSSEEVEQTKNQHILARISQYEDNQDGINIKECSLAKEYIESGIGNQPDETTVGGCTRLEASAVQTDFQDCSHQLTQDVWGKIQSMEEAQQKERGIQERETNDVLEQEEKDDEIQLDPSELKRVLCKALHDIGDNCSTVINKCFSEEDLQQMRFNHIQQMAHYYGGIYTNVDLSGCKALTDFVVSVSEPCDPDEKDENDNYIDCEDPSNPEIIPAPDYDYEGEDNKEDHTIPKPSTLNNIQKPTTASPPVVPSTVISDPVDPITPAEPEPTNADDEHKPPEKAELNTPSDDGNCNKAQHLLIALTSVILATIFK